MLIHLGNKIPKPGLIDGQKNPKPGLIDGYKMSETWFN